MNIGLVDVGVERKVVHVLSNMINTKKCPYCGSDRGYYMHEKVHRSLFFDFNNEPMGASEDMTDYTGKRKYCKNCNRILPGNLFEQN